MGSVPCVFLAGAAGAVLADFVAGAEAFFTSDATDFAGGLDFEVAALALLDFFAAAGSFFAEDLAIKQPSVK